MIMKAIHLSLLILLSFSVNAQTEAWDRSKQLGKGMNLSWMENWWTGSAASNYSDYLDLNELPGRKEDLKLMSQLGLKTVRLPVVFDVWEDGQIPYDFDQIQYFEATDSILAWCKHYDLNLIIDYQHGSLTQNNYLSEGDRIAALWRQIADRYKNSDPEKVFFELYNEPHDLTAESWQSTAEKIVAAIREVAPNHTLIAGGIYWNDIGGLLELEPFEDKNIIYTFHYYEPFLFTHQGTEWVGAPTATLGIPFPYDADLMPPLAPAAKGTWGESAYNAYAFESQYSTMEDAVGWAKLWSNMMNLPILCGEWGSYYKAGLENRCRHATVVREIMEYMDIPFCYWEWDQGFSLFEGEPAIEHLPECMQTAFFGDLILSSTDIKDSKLQIFPNPNQGQFWVKGINPDQFEKLVVQSVDGRLLRTIYSFDQVINLTDLPAGIYWLRFVEKKSGRTVIRKLVMQY